MTPQQVIEHAAIKGAGQHDRCSLMLARGLRLNCGLTLEQALPYYQQWWAKGVLHCSNQDPDAALFKFEDAWSRVRVSLGAGVAQEVLDQLKSVVSVPESLRFGPGCSRLVSALAEMSRRVGGEDFKISAHMVAEALGVTPQTAHEWFGLLSRRKLITVVDRGKPGTGGSGVARRIRWLGSTPPAPTTNEHTQNGKASKS